jgi:hypothetical protein
MPCNRPPNSRFSATVNSWSRVLACELTPIRCLTRRGSRATSAPHTRAVPPVGLISVVSMPIVVDLPAPFGPSSPKSSPGATSRSSPATAASFEPG